MTKLAVQVVFAPRAKWCKNCMSNPDTGTFCFYSGDNRWSFLNLNESNIFFDDWWKVSQKVYKVLLLKNTVIWNQWITMEHCDCWCFSVIWHQWITMEHCKNSDCWCFSVIWHQWNTMEHCKNSDCWCFSVIWHQWITVEHCYHCVCWCFSDMTHIYI
jgi:hypothetical protein